MKKLYLFAFTAFLLASSQKSNAQTLPLLNNRNVIRCYTVEVMEEYRRKHPGAETNAEFEKWLGRKKQERRAQRELIETYTVPVVFHIISKGEAVGSSPNLSAALIQQQLLELNKNFANKTSSPYLVSADAGIQFVLATTNMAGNTMAEPGIDRLNIDTQNWTDYDSGWETSYIDETVKPQSIWNPNNYINIWIVPSFNRGTNTLLGYATFPLSSSLPGLSSGETDQTCGVVVATSTIGSAFEPGDCGNGFGLGKTLTHELGHFFGLRHIWGDTDCGNDFCDDTPVHFAQNRGTPSHPKSNSCGTPDEMFENFMDYTDDVKLNTFTADQVARMQTVMVNSPRRVSLAISPVGGVPISATNRISFTNCSGELTEQETASSTSYPRYKDVYLTLNAEDKATGNATVNFTFSGTAVRGDDYQLLTPATATFVAGESSKPVNIRIFDNAKTDIDRTIVIGYTIAGSGVIAGADAQTVTITIADDDNIRIGENTINLLDEKFENPTGNFGLPLGWGLLTTSNYTNLFVASANGDAGGSGNAAHITSDRLAKPNTYNKGVSGAAILQSPIIDGSSVMSIGSLSFKYKVRGLQNNDEAYLTYTNAASPFGPFYFFGSSGGPTGYGPYSSNSTLLTKAPVIKAPAVLNNTKFNIDFYWQTGSLTTGVAPGFNVDDIVLTATPFHVETAVSNSYTYDVKPGNGINNFKSTNNKAIATITNASNKLTAVTARVSGSGNGTTTINSPGGSFLRSKKVFQLSPSTADATSTYEARFYFTQAEMTGWGENKLKLKILKVKEGVDLNGTITKENGELITPTVTEDSVADYITYSGNFTGLGQYMLVPPGFSFVITLTNFTATANQKNIQLAWSTLLEINNKGFIVERGTDGTTFSQIGWVDGVGNSTQTTNYGFLDNFVQPKQLYYYRIRQVNNDSSQVFSAIKSATVAESSGISLSVSPNPATNYVNLFIIGSTSKADIEVVNMLGQRVILITDANLSDGVYNLPLRGLMKGVYTVRAHLTEGIYTRKLVVE